MTTIDQFRIMIREEIGKDRPNRRTDAANAIWVFPEWTVPNTTRKENPGTFLAQARLAAVQAVHAAENSTLTDARIEEIAQRVAALIKQGSGPNQPSER